MARLDLDRRVFLSNVARNHSYHLAQALDEAGYLEKFVTCIYYKPQTAKGRAMHHLAVRAGERSRKRLELRRAPAISDERIVDIPLPEVVEETALRLGARLGMDARAVVYLKNEVFDWLVAHRHLKSAAVFHGFEQCSLFSLRKARALGAITVLEQPIIHRTTLERIEREERARHGVPAPERQPLWFHQHVARKYKELELTDYVFGGLDYVKQTMVENGFAGDRVFVVPYGADTGEYHPIDRPPRKGLNVLYAGPLNFWKGLPYVFDVMDRIHDPDIRLTLIGRSDPDWRPYMDRRIAALGDRARYLGTVPQSEMPRIYADADVMVFPSLVGGLGIVCFEAMATGLPVMTSDGDVIIRDGVDGLTIPPVETERWCRALGRLAEDRDYRLRLGAAGADRLKSFTWDAYRRGVKRAYEEIVNREEEKAPVQRAASRPAPRGA